MAYKVCPLGGPVPTSAHQPLKFLRALINPHSPAAFAFREVRWQEWPVVEVPMGGTPTQPTHQPGVACAGGADCECGRG